MGTSYGPSRRTLVGLAAAVALAAVTCGCMSQETIAADPRVTSRFNGSRIATFRREPPQFQFGTAGTLLLAGLGLVPAVFGGAEMQRAGDVVIREYELEDPAVYVGRKLLADLAPTFGFIPVVATDSIVSVESAQKLSAQYPDVQYLLDVRTNVWGVQVHPVRWTRYFVNYSAQMRLIETASGKVVAQSFCAKGFGRPGERPTRDELLANRAQRLKDELRLDADDCVEQFKARVLERSGDATVPDKASRKGARSSRPTAAAPWRHPLRA